MSANFFIQNLNMVMFYALVVVLCLFGNAVAQVAYLGKCPDFEAQSDFDVNKFKGIWYNVERYPVVFEPSAVCSFSDFQPGKNGTIDVTDHHVTGEKNIRSHLTMVPQRDDPSVYHFRFPLSPQRASTDCKFLGSDYDSYTDISCCTNSDSINMRYVYVMTRDPLPNKSTLEKAYEVLDKNNIDRQPLEKIDMTNCLPKKTS